MNTKNVLEMKNITKRFPGVVALDSVNFSVREGEVHCLIGANGAGKSTLVKILTGDIPQDSGEIFFYGEKLTYHGANKCHKKEISAIYQELSLLDCLTVGENVFLNNYPRTKLGLIDWKQVYAQTDELIEKMNFNINSKSEVGSLNAGQKQITEIMKALARHAKLIVMDEPSSTLSESEFNELRKVISDLKSQGITIIYISHHLEELFAVGDRVTVLRDGKYITCENLSDINEQQLVSFMTGIQPDSEKEKIGKNEISDEVVLELQHLCNQRVKDINLSLHKGEILGMYGLVGSGRSEAMASVFGTEPHNSGKILLHGQKFNPKNTTDAIRHGIGMIPENRMVQGMVKILPVWENIAMADMKKFRKFGLLNYSNMYSNGTEYKKQLDIKTASVKNAIGNLSGGNQQKAIVAKWLTADSDILIVDEPTQGIDVMVKQEIYKIIINSAAAGKSVIVISSELNELLNVCNRIFVMYDGREVGTVSSENFSEQLIMNAAITGRMAQ